MKIALILPTYNNEELTIKCIHSINKYVQNDEDITIIWVDNNSSLESKKNVLNEFQNLKKISYEPIFLSKNNGFIKAVNIGIKFSKKSKYDYIGIINNDIEVSNNWLKNLINILKSDKEIMVAGAMAFNTPSNKINLFELNETPELNTINENDFEKVVKKLQKLNLQPKIYSINDFSDESFKNTYVAYYATIFNPLIFSKIGFLNENFNLGYSDDTEFNYRIVNAGYKIAKAKNTIVIHNSRSTFKTLYKNEFINLIQGGNKLQLKISKLLNKNKSKKYVIYTAIINDYDELKTPSYINTEYFDYICFTNSTSIVSLNVYPWTIINVNDIILSLNEESPVKWARYFKTHPHLFFENYEKSIWIDSNIDIINDPLNYIDHLQDGYVLIPDHPTRNSIYEEIKACNDMKKDSENVLVSVKKFLIDELFPNEKSKLVQSNVILRDHNNEKCKFLMEKWWEMIKKYSKRDQLSFNYIFWKYDGEYQSIPWDLISLKYFTTDYKHKGAN